MLDHVGIQVDDVARSKEFYTALLAPLGFGPVLEFGDAVGFGPDERSPHFWLSKATEALHHEAHVAFAAPDRAGVDAVHAVAIARGVEVLHSPRLFPEYHPGYYGVFVRDPDGNNVEAVTHGAER